MAIIPYYECPRFLKCNVNKCPLDPEINLRNSYKTDEKCNMEKQVRYKIGSKYPNLLKYQGLTKREWFGKQLSDKYHAQTELEFTQGDKSPKNAKAQAIPTLITIIILISLLSSCVAYAESINLKASWYSIASLKRDGQWKITKGVMANGKQFSDNLMVCASCDFRLGDRLLVSTKGKSVIVKVTDQTNRRFKGKRIDLSKRAFGELTNNQWTLGIVSVTVEVVND